MKTLIVYTPFHNLNTEKVAKVMAEEVEADIVYETVSARARQN
jgi:flavodoxin